MTVLTFSPASLSKPIVRSAANAADAVAPPLIALEGVHKAYPARRTSSSVTALDNVDLVVGQGSIVGVIGRSGAGKSTLIRLVNGLERPTAGRVVVDGTEISSLGQRELRMARRSIGMIFQHFNLLSSRTAFGNIALPLEIAHRPASEIAKRVDTLLDLVGLSDKRDRYPAELSGGQKQRIGIARALATNPKVLLSDEATSALDPETTSQILQLLKRINAEFKLTILLITHEMSVVQSIADRVAVLEAGRLVEQGPTFDIFAHPKHPTTRSFVSSISGAQLPEALAAELRDAPFPASRTVVRLTWAGRNGGNHVLAELARRLAVDFALLHGRIDSIANQPFASLVVALPVDEAAARKALQESGAEDVTMEVLGHVA